MEWFGNRLASPLYMRYVSKLGLTGNERVMDFGCGGGVLAKQFAKILNHDGSVTCLDTSAFWLAKAKQRLKRFQQVDFACRDITKLNIPDSSYDVVSIHFVLHDITPDRRAEIITALARILKAKGRLFIREPTKASHGMPAAEIRALMRTAGLKEKNGIERRCLFLGPVYKGVFEKS